MEKRFLKTTRKLIELRLKSATYIVKQILQFAQQDLLFVLTERGLIVFLQYTASKL